MFFIHSCQHYNRFMPFFSPSIPGCHIRISLFLLLCCRFLCGLLFFGRWRLIGRCLIFVQFGYALGNAILRHSHVFIHDFETLFNLIKQTVLDLLPLEYFDAAECPRHKNFAFVARRFILRIGIASVAAEIDVLAIQFPLADGVTNNLAKSQILNDCRKYCLVGTDKALLVQTEQQEWLWNPASRYPTYLSFLPLRAKEHSRSTNLKKGSH
mmetsp:Transcript_16334/g.39874  ORF Transcript_16334/g.39874 Transcript_16334/m.39874 type:complete len:211 (+) Transcript_16334:222-854(+)